MAAALVAGQTGVAAGSGVLSVGVAFPSNVTAGNAILVFARFSSNADLTISDTLGNTFTPIVNHLQTTDNHKIFVWVAKNISGGANTVTVAHGTLTTRKMLTIYEISGLDTTTPEDQNNAVQGADASLESGSITMTRAGVILSGWGNAGTQTVTIDTDYTNKLEDAATGRGGSCLRFTSAITDEAIHTASAANDWNCCAANFMEPAAGGGANPKGPLSNPLAGPFGGPI